MAKAKLPLMSFNAHGSISKALTFRASNGVNIVSRYSKPNDYRQTVVSELQAEQRALYSAGVTDWNALSESEKLEYATRALPLHLTGFNLYMSEYLTTQDLVFSRLLETGDNRLLETGDLLLLE